MENNNILICVIGPSGCGKSRRVYNYINDHPDIANLIVSDTTRPKRELEIDGQDYNFVTGFKTQDYLESTVYNGHLYGVSKKEFEDKTSSARITFFICDVEGYNVFRVLYKNTYSIYIKAFSSECIKNLTDRDKDITIVKNRIFYDASVNAYSLDEMINFDAIIKKYGTWQELDEEFKKAIEKCIVLNTIRNEVNK